MLGLVWAAFWYWLYEPPDRQPRLSEEEREYIKAGQEEHLRHVEGKPSVGRIARARNFWGIAIPRFLADPTWGTLTFWVPLYLSTARGFDLKQIALFAWLPFLAADIGSVFGGVVAMALHRRGVSIVDARRWAFTLGALLMTPVAAVGFVRSPYLAIALISLAGFAHQTLSVTVITMASDLFRRSEVATVAGMAGFFGNFGLLVFNLLIGGLVASVGYTPFFVVLGVLDLLGAVVLWTVVREPVAQRA
jgi:ACS family hexuronate transporter-like MFS transporter